MSTEHKQSLGEAARRRTLATEKKERDLIASVWGHIPAESQRIFTYVDKAIDDLIAGTREPEDGDIAYFRETRQIHFRPFRKHLSEAA